MMKNNNSDLYRFLIVSLILHLSLALLLIFGMPSLFRKLPEEQIISFEMVTVSDQTNLKTQKIQRDKTAEEEKAKSVKNSAKDALQEEAPTPKEEVQKVKPDTNPYESVKEPLKQEPIAKPEVIKPTEPLKKEEKKEEAKPKNAANTKTENDKKKTPPKKKDLDLNSLLKTLEKASEGQEEKSRKESRSEKTDAETESKGPYDDSNPISISEHQAIKQQIESNWNIPIAAKNSSQITITLNIALKPDGDIMSVKLVNTQCSNADSITCQAVIDSLFRAVHQASPFQNLSPSRYSAWKEFNIECQPPSM